MRIQYFEDTDTLLLVFKETPVNETTDLDENTLVEFDAEGNLVTMTIEHARERPAGSWPCLNRSAINAPKAR